MDSPLDLAPAPQSRQAPQRPMTAAGNRGSLRPAVEVAETAAQAARLVAEWQDLAGRAAEPNPFYEPWCLLPALELFAGQERIRVVFVRDTASHGGDLIGVFPLVLRQRFYGLPLATLAAWRHPQMFLAAPLVDAGRAGLAWRLLLGWAHRAGARLIDLPDLPGDSPAMVPPAASVAMDGFERRVLRRDPEGAEVYIAKAATAKSRKSWRRQLRRLSEQGSLEPRALGRGDPAAAWIEDFLALEAEGWKGREGTAVVADPSASAFFRRCCLAAAARGELHMAGLFLDGRPIALQCNFLSAGGAGMAFKVAYDEAFARYSPGVLLELEAIRDLHGRDTFRWMDSCTGDGHALMARLWRHDRRIERRLVAVSPLSGPTLLAALKAVRRIRTGIRGARVRLAGGGGR
ncbi:GNAT family N-acetyltransferase [Acidimangrovimonas pyrenivorans]|uniref:GNAT family N-acetyltransferase n=1 Tax=Acidimangrovimonas pyrenivorans TaxID=2030798 RepID=A0ABV7AFZ8_9RHOB